ncbi:MAG: zinc-binding alcohol dehydrogenase family protein [Devosia sp.]|nr:zinc-binding alcohol dehydrogenase family protein [Devosia sp.]
MDVLVCAEPGVLRLERRPAPAALGGDVLVRPRRVGICGTDYHIFEGKHPYLEYPRVMGHELAVEIVSAPAGSSWTAGTIAVVNPYVSCGSCIACRNGKPNCCVRIGVLGVHRDGGMADLLVVPERNLVRAEGLDLDACAAVEFLAIGAHAVRRGNIVAGEKALVVGAGPIGLGAAIFARLSGAAVTMMDVDPERLALAQAVTGGKSIVAGSAAAGDAAAATAGEGFDIVFDATGNPASMERGFDFVAHGGRYVLVSVVRGAIRFEDADFHRKEMTLLGSRNATDADFRRVIAEISAGRIPLERIITHRTTLADAVVDLPRWATVKAGLVKAIIAIGDH